jgi:hypothetical protein
VSRDPVGVEVAAGRVAVAARPPGERENHEEQEQEGEEVQREVHGRNPPLG